VTSGAVLEQMGLLQSLGLPDGRWMHSCKICVSKVYRPRLPQHAQIYVMHEGWGRAASWKNWTVFQIAGFRSSGSMDLGLEGLWWCYK
jgi:hypothetical protein